MIVKTGVDSYVDEDRPSANYGKGVKLWVDDRADLTKYAYIYFARPFPRGVTIAEATLRVTLADGWAGSNTLTAKRIRESWKENRIDWNNRPAVATDHSADVSVSSLAAGNEVELDLTAMLGDVSDGERWFGVRLEVTAGGKRSLKSSDAKVAADRPTLEIVWTNAPEPPAGLAPSGGRAISKTKPLLRWQFTDNAGNTEQSASQVQISTTSDFSSPSYDSGKEPNTKSQWDLADADDPVFSALSDGATRYWRVRVWDGADLVSDWSTVVSFTRESKGTLTITNPDVPPGNVTEETTPPIAWTFSGRTQRAWTASLYRVAANGKRTQLAHRSKGVSTATEWEIPAGIIREDETYLVRLIVFDTIDRQAMPGDSDGVAAERTFTYERDGSPDPVLTMVAEPEGAKVHLTFTRAEDPDYFALKVGGRLVDDRIEVADVFVSGDTYEYDYYLAEPRKTRSYEMEAVVSSGGGPFLHSAGNATDTARTDPLGIWIVDPRDQLAVFIAGKEKASMAIGEQGETYYPIGNRQPVRIIDAITGYEGSFKGILTDYDDLTALQWRDRFLELKGRLVDDLRLIIGDLNIPVMLGPVSCIPSPDGDQSYDVSFDFWQTGEFDDAFELAGEG